jgi:tetratricopeptide (TPR) repeat protein
MLSKETAVVLPLLVFSYAWSYGCVSGGPPSVAELARRHARFWLALVATWAVLAAVLVAESGAYGELGAQQHPRLAYLVTQAGVLLHYLRLSCWPAGQNLDSDWPLVRDLAAAVPQVAVVAVALVAAAWGLLRRRAWGWPAAAFFLLLAPTSSVLPVIDIANEHRMYLPLACLVTLVVAGAAEALRRVATAWPRHATLLGRMAILLAAAAVVALGAATHARNRVYHDRGRLWSDVLAKSPESPRANSIVAVMLARRGRVDEAIALARRAAARDPWGTTFHTLGEVLAAAGDHAGCERACRAGIEALEATEAAGRQPEFNLQAGLVTAVVEQGRLTEAADLVAGRLPAIRAALGEDHPITLSMELVAVRLKLMRREHDGGIAAARRLFDAATRRLGGGHPTTLSAETVLAIALAEEGDDPAAERHLRHVLAMQADAGPRGSAWRSTALLLADFLESRGQTAAAAALRTAAEPPR